MRYLMLATLFLLAACVADAGSPPPPAAAFEAPRGPVVGTCEDDAKNLYAALAAQGFRRKSTAASGAATIERWEHDTGRYMLVARQGATVCLIAAGTGWTRESPALGKPRRLSPHA